MIERKLRATDSQSPTRLLILPLWLIAIYAAGMLMAEASTICLWIVCGFFLFVLLDPISQYLKSKRWPQPWTAVLLVLTATVAAAFTLYVLAYFFSGMVIELQHSKKIFMHLFESFNTTWNSWNAKIPGFHSAVSSANAEVPKVEVVQDSPLSSEMSGTILHGLGNAVTVLVFALLVPILSFFLLAERDAIARVLRRAYLEQSRATLTWEKIVKATQAYFLGNLVLGVITFPIFILLFWVFAVPSLFTAAALATVFNLVPFAGALLSGFLPSVELYTHAQNVGATLGLYGCCVAIHFIVADFVTPKVLGSRVNINATTSTIALVAWGEIWGGVGLLLAIPLTALVKIMFEHSDFFWLQWVAALMSEDVDQALEVPGEQKREAKKNAQTDWTSSPELSH